MTSRSSKYWQQRTLQVEDTLHNKGVEYYHELEKQYSLAAKSTQQELAVLYGRMAKNNGISMAEAKKLLTTRELKEFRWTVQEYIEKGRDNAISEQWMQQLENASLRYRISRLEAMKIQMQHHAEVLMGNEVDSMSKMLTSMYTEGYYRTGHMLQTGFGVGHSFAELDTRQVEKVIGKPWAADGKNFSERIWGNHRPQLVNDLHTGLTQNIIKGSAPDKLIEDISKSYNVAKKKAGTLVMTESSYFSNLSQQDCYAELDVEEQQFTATLDTKTSTVCQDMDGKIIATSDIIIGENAPPLHPNCRSVMSPYFEGNRQGRAARDADGNYVTVPGDMTYHEWYEQFVEGTPADKKKNKRKAKTSADKNKPLKQKVDEIKLDLDAKYDDLKTQKTTLQSKNTELKTVNNEINDLQIERMDLQVKKDTYDRLKDRDFDTEIAAKQAEREQLAARVDELQKQHDRYYDRPERGTPEREAWEQWRKDVDFQELFENLVDEQSKLSRADIELKYLNEDKLKRAGIDIDKLNKDLKRVDDDLLDKNTTKAMLNDDITNLNKGIADTRTGIEDDYKRAGNEFISELKQADLMNDDELERLRKANDSAYFTYQKETDPVKRAKLADEYNKANEAFFDYKKRMPIENAAKVKETLSQVRSVGASDPAGLVKNHLNNSKSAIRKSVTDAYELYPTEWVDVSAAFSKLSLKKVPRGYYSHSKSVIAISGFNHPSQFPTAIHELGHRFERVVDDLLEIEKTFYERRTKGEKLQWLGFGYGYKEVSRFDDFLHAYMGKDYSGTAYELVSMGFEYGFTNPLYLMQDMDMAELIFGLLLMK